MVVIGIFSCGMLSFTVRQSTTAYFFIYNVGDPSLIASFFQKLAKTIGGAGAALVLGFAGYQANQVQSAQALVAIHGVLTLVPIGIMVILVVLTNIYPLDKSAHDQLVKDLTPSA